MMPRKDDEALVDLLDVILRDGVILRADVIISVAEIPLVGLKLTAALAGMDTMTEYGLFEEWDVERRRSPITRRQYGNSTKRRGERDSISVGTRGESTALGQRSRDANGIQSEENDERP
ncbi:gas vesicle protein [Halostagnicola sp. A-GB9-2]|uniref:gas vesicle protein GvpM n=1 Tax=Halostagnicola sp. A-GB9-2 TaxID=3048066 RepID=UPI0024C0E639|nr:gas vesicle protein [Halostagnicola sp. A-GB9-2]MDJ1431718.1 gas vesicle protein [Halostagnicola sp. A-GB9-2]